MSKSLVYVFYDDLQVFFLLFCQSHLFHIEACGFGISVFEVAGDFVLSFNIVEIPVVVIIHITFLQIM